MRMPTKREWVLLTIVSAVIFAAAGANRADDDRAGAVAELSFAAKSKSDAGRAADAANWELSQLRRDSYAVETKNAFETKSWRVLPPPSLPPVQRMVPMAPPPAPSAPPLPFTYLGRYENLAKSVIFLVRGDRLLLVSAGDVIEGTYRVEGITGTVLGMTYLPLNVRQTLNIGHAG